MRGPSFDFVLTQERSRFFETSIGVTLPLLPFNNDVVIEFDGQAWVNRDDTQDIRNMQTDGLEDFPIQVEVYIRSKYYPHKILSGARARTEKEVMNLGNRKITKKLTFALNSDYVQADSANYADLIFDFSEIVRGDADEVKNSEKWHQAKVALTKVTVETKCRKAITYSLMEKYQATILALRARVLAPRYRTTVEYEVGGDSASPAGIYAAFVFLILVFIGVVVYTGWKIKLFNRRILDDKVEIEKEKGQLVGYQDEVIRLRKLKLI